MPTKVILDVDTGTDDAVALMLAALHPELELVGATTVTGNVTLAVTGPAALIGDNPFPFGAYGPVGGAFVRSRPGQTGLVTVSAGHPALGRATVQVKVTAVLSGSRRVIGGQGYRRSGEPDRQ